MSNTTPRNKTGWQLVAQALKDARVRQGFKLRSDLVTHLVTTGQAKPSIDRILGDLERASRDNYSPATLAGAENWYGLPAGEISRLLAGAKATRKPRSRLAQLGDERVIAPTFQPVANLSTIELLKLATAITEELAIRANINIDLYLEANRSDLANVTEQEREAIEEVLGDGF